MKATKIKKDKLLKILRKNRDEHRDIFLKAQKVYRKAVIDELDKMLAELRNGKPFVSARVTGITIPRDYTKEYDRVILMLELGEDRVVELDHLQFTQYVMDEWGWSRDWAVSNSNYVQSAKFTPYTTSDE